MQSNIQTEINSLTKELITLEIQFELSRIVNSRAAQQSQQLSLSQLKNLVPEDGLKSQLNLCTVELGLLAKAIEQRYDHQFTLSALFIQQGEPVSDLSLEEIATFIYHQEADSLKLLNFKDAKQRDEMPVALDLVAAKAA